MISYSSKYNDLFMWIIEVGWREVWYYQQGYNAGLLPAYMALVSLLSSSLLSRDQTKMQDFKAISNVSNCKIT